MNKFISEKELHENLDDVEDRALKKESQSAESLLWDSLRGGASDQTNQPEDDGKALWEKLEENSKKAAEQREEQFQNAVFQAPRVYNDDELRFLAEQDSREKKKEYAQRLELEEFEKAAQQARAAGIVQTNETEATIKLLARHKKPQEASFLRRKSGGASTQPSRKRDDDADELPASKRPKLLEFVEDDAHMETANDQGEGQSNPLAALLGYDDDTTDS